MPKHTPSCFFHDWINKLTDLQFHAVLFCFYVADPATFLALNSVLGTLFSSENSLLINVLSYSNSFYYQLIDIVNTQILFVWISSPKATVSLFNVNVAYVIYSYCTRNVIEIEKLK